MDSMDGLPAPFARKRGGHLSFPASNPVSISRSDLGTLDGQVYYICEKTEGERALLWVDPRGASVFADRRMCPHPPAQRGIDLPILPDLASTLLDGEVVWNWRHGRFDYLVFDALMVRGTLMVNEPFTARLSSFTEVYPHGQCPQLQVKHFFHLRAREQVCFDAHYKAANALYDLDGVILTPEKQPVKSGRNWKQFKWKPQLANTVDLRVDEAHQAFVCNSLEPVGRVRSGADTPIRPGLWECSWDPEQQVWEAVRVRHDKKEANDDLTYKNTLINIREDIQLRELFLRSYSEEDVSEVARMLRENLKYDGNCELEFRFDKVSRDMYESVHSKLSTALAVSREHQQDQSRNNLRRSSDPANPDKARVFSKKRLAQYTLKDRRDVKCVVSSEEEVFTCKVNWARRPGDVVRDKRRASFQFREAGGLVWSYDLTCVNLESYEIEIECSEFGKQHDPRFIAESGLMKCYDVLRMF